MGSIKDIFESLFSNAKARVNDPFFGPFILSWVVWNWRPVALLLFGDERASEKINQFQNYLSEGDFFHHYSLHIYPLISSLVYVFGLPWIKLWFNSLQNYSEKKLHTQAVERDAYRYKELGDLNKIKLLSDPSKKFLEQAVQNEMNLLEAKTERESIEKQKAAHEEELLRVQIELQGVELKNAQIRTEEAAAIAAEAKAKAVIEEKKQEDEARKLDQQTKLSKQQFHNETLKNKAVEAANRFPSSFMFLEKLSAELKKDELAIPVAAAAEVIALIFGYSDFNKLLHDSDFENDQFSDVKFVFYDEGVLSKGLQAIENDHNLTFFEVGVDTLFDSVISMFDDLPYKFVNEEALKEICEEFLEKNKYELFDDNAVSGEMAISDTSYDEVNIESVEDLLIGDEMVCTITASASGTHRSDPEIPGVDLSISVDVKSDVIVGRYALGKLSMTATANLEYE